MLPATLAWAACLPTALAVSSSSPRFDNSCQPQCSPGYFEANPGVCGPCGYNCKTCTVRGPFNCTSCFSDSYLRQDGACYMYCALGTFYDPVMQFCQACDFSCKNCSGSPPRNVCLARLESYLLPDGSCQKNCPARTYIKDGVSCHACSTTCETCTGETEKDCSLCASGLFMTANSTCLPECDLRFFSEPKSRKCLACDPTCVTCTGEGKDQCLSCANPEYCSLTQAGTCIDCSEKAEEYPDLCTTTTF
jgi:proprotein convertase subtilisin/kexin type 5